MNTSYLRLTPVLLGFLLVTSGVAADQGPFALLHSLFDPGTNAQQYSGHGYSVALDGNFVAVGAPFENTGGESSGVVNVYNATTGARLHTLTNPAPSVNDSFGRAVAVSGTRLVVGAYQDDTGAADAGSAYVYDLASARPTVPVLTLTNPSPRMFDQFGSSVAISGTRVAIGAEYGDAGAIDAGSVYVFDIGSAAPALPVLTLTSPIPTPSGSFGSSLAISDERVVVGSRFDGTGEVDAGSAYVYEFTSITPAVPIHTLNNPRPAVADYFGFSVAICEKRVVVGANRDHVGGFEAGSAYVYDLASATPTAPFLTLTNPTPDGSDWFGSSVSIAGTRVVVSAPFGGPGRFDEGAAYVYDVASTTPAVPVTTLTNPVPTSSAMFGYSVALSGTRVAVGAPWDDTGATGAGSAYVYDLGSTTPTELVARLNNSSSALLDRFGYFVAISGTRMVCGAPWDDTGAADAGSAYVYDLASITPTVPVLTLTNPSPAASDNFGFAITISGTRAVVSAPFGGPAFSDDGVVYVYDLASTTPTVPVATLNNPSLAGGDLFGHSVAISGTRVVAGVYLDNTGAPQAGSAYVYDLASSTPAVPVLTLTNPSPQWSDIFGFSVAVDATLMVVGAPGAETGETDAGSAYVYDLGSTTPTVPMLTLTNPSPAINDRFGSSVAISGARVVVAAYRGITGPLNSGTVHVYDLASATPTVPAASLPNPHPAGFDSFGVSVAISGTRMVVGAHRENSGAPEAGRAYVYDLTSVTPTSPVAMLANPSPALRDYFGFSVAIEGTTIVAGAPNDDTNAEDRGAAYVFGLQPALNIVPAAPGLATISWAPATSAFVLQYTDSFSPTNWLSAPSGASNPVTIPTTTSRFYRLFQP